MDRYWRHWISGKTLKPEDLNALEFFLISSDRLAIHPLDWGIEYLHDTESLYLKDKKIIVSSVRGRIRSGLPVWIGKDGVDNLEWDGPVDGTFDLYIHIKGSADKGSADRAEDGENDRFPNRFELCCNHDHDYPKLDDSLFLGQYQIVDQQIKRIKIPRLVRLSALDSWKNNPFFQSITGKIQERLLEWDQRPNSYVKTCVVSKIIDFASQWPYYSISKFIRKWENIRTLSRHIASSVSNLDISAQPLHTPNFQMIDGENDGDQVFHNLLSRLVFEDTGPAQSWIFNPGSVLHWNYNNLNLTLSLADNYSLIGNLVLKFDPSPCIVDASTGGQRYEIKNCENWFTLPNVCMNALRGGNPVTLTGFVADEKTFDPQNDITAKLL